VAVIVRTMGHSLLPRALASLAAQTHANLQTILVVAKPGWRPAPSLVDARMTVLETDVPLPRPLAANRGLDAARADYLAFLDEDDWLLPTHVAGLVAALASNPGYALAYSDTRIGAEGGEVMRRGYWKQRFQDYPVFTINAALFASSLVAAGCRFDTALELIEDWDFWLQCAEHTDFLHVPHATAGYDPGSGGSGTGRAENADRERALPHNARLQRKWVARYQAIEARSAAALERATALIGASAFDAARDALATGLQGDPGNPVLLNRLSLALVRLGDTAGALAALRRACDVDAVALDLRLQLALLEHHCGQHDAAARTLNAAGTLATDPAGQARVAAAAARVRTG
jgi:hypothetical protein